MVEPSLRVTRRPDGLVFPVRVKPRARRAGVEGVQDGVLQVALREPPLEGRANEALIRLLASAMGVRRRRLRLLRGARSREKLVLLHEGAAYEMPWPCTESP